MTIRAEELVRRITDYLSVAQPPRRQGHDLVPVEKPLGDSGAFVFLDAAGRVYERRANGVIRRVKK